MIQLIMKEIYLFLQNEKNKNLKLFTKTISFDARQFKTIAFKLKLESKQSGAHSINLLYLFNFNTRRYVAHLF
jgi:hypothetical protein